MRHGQVLQLEHISWSEPIEAVGPEVGVGLGVDQLRVGADLVARPTDASFQHIADIQLAADLLRVDWLVLISERVLREITSMPAIRDRSVVRSSVMPSAKYSLLRVAAQIGKRQHHDRQARCPAGCETGVGERRARYRQIGDGSGRNA